MLTDMSTSRPGTPATTAATARRSHDDAPDTVELFTRLAALDDGPERDAVRDELVAAWLPMAHRIAGRSATAASPWRICARWRRWAW